MILYYIVIYLCIVAGFHIFLVGVQHGLGIGETITRALLRESMRLLLRSGSIIYLHIQYKRKKNIIHKNRTMIYYCRMALILFCGGSILYSWIHNQSLYAILIGFKYSLRPLCIALTAITLGWYMAISKTYSTQDIQSRYKKIIKLFLVCILGGILFQLSKHIFPHIRTQWGYGPVGDFVFNQAPPLYYRTGPGGWPRFSGLFAGPNNYGFFLVAITSIFRLGNERLTGIQGKWHKVLHGISTVATLSRGALLAVGAQITWGYTCTHKKLWKSTSFIVSAALGAIIIISLFIFKWGSTLQHIESKLENIDIIWTQPFGEGLGSAGAAVFHVNAILPENIFLQLVADIGIRGLAIWCSLWILYIRKTHTILQTYADPLPIHRLRYLMTRGIIALMAEGMFLHVRDDSMVNYLILLPWGIVGGYIRGSYSTRETTSESIAKHKKIHIHSSNNTNQL